MKDGQKYVHQKRKDKVGRIDIGWKGENFIRYDEVKW